MKLTLINKEERIETDWEIHHILGFIHAYGILKDKGLPMTLNQLCRRMRYKPDYEPYRQQWDSLMKMKPKYISDFKVFTDHLEIELTPRKKDENECTLHLMIKLGAPTIGA